MPETDPRYWAFLSYSHADARFAQWLRRQLEGYAIPARLVGRTTPAGVTPARLRPIFRDREEMGAGPDLSERLKRALSDSAYLIVICSPAAVKSAWVNEEISLFKALRGDDRVLAAMVSGVPFASELAEGADQECFPEPLRRRLTGEGAGSRIEALAADFRPGQDSRRGALLKLISGILQIDLDEIVRRDAQRQYRRLSLIAGASVVTALGMGALALAAIEARNEAIAQRTQAESLIEFMIGDLRKKLEPAGRLDTLDAIGAHALAYYAAQQDRGLDAAALGQHARVLHLLGDIQEQRGDLPAAFSLFTEAAKSTGELLRRHPNDAQAIFDHTQSLAYIGEVAFQRGQTSLALDQFGERQRLARRLVAIAPSNQDWQEEVAEADTDKGVALLGESHADEAAGELQEALAISTRLAAGAPQDRERQFDKAQILAWLADAEVSRGRLDAASSDRAAEAQIYARLVADSPGDTGAAVALAASRAANARIRMATGAVPAAIADLEAAAADMNRLMGLAPDNARYKSNAAPILILLSQALLQDGQLAAGAEVASQAVSLSEAVAGSAQGHGDEALMWRGQRLGAARIVRMKIAAAAAPTPKAQSLALAPAAAEAARLRRLLGAHAQTAALARAAAEATLLEGDSAYLDGRPSEAKSTWLSAQTILQTAAKGSSATDRTAMLLRQLAFRLSFRRLPNGPLSSSPTGPLQIAEMRRPADYRW
jgi:eukaryotic-like serine/threonine-protein kinase